MRRETFSADEFGFEISYRADALECVSDPADPRLAWILTAMLPFGVVSPVLFVPHDTPTALVIANRASLVAVATWPVPTPHEVVEDWTWGRFTDACASWVLTSTQADVISVQQYKWHGIPAVSTQAYYEEQGYLESYGFLADPRQTFSLVRIEQWREGDEGNAIIQDACDGFHLLPYERERYGRERNELVAPPFLARVVDPSPTTGG
jgi:hypothetical protein